MPKTVCIVSLGQLVSSNHHLTIGEFIRLVAQEGRWCPTLCVNFAFFFDFFKSQTGCCQNIIDNYKKGLIDTDMFRNRVRAALGIPEVSDDEFDQAWNAMSDMDASTTQCLKNLIASLSDNFHIVVAAETNPLHTQRFFAQLGNSRKDLAAKGIHFVFSYEENTLDRYRLAQRGLGQVTINDEDTILSLHSGISDHTRTHVDRNQFNCQPYYPNQHNGKPIALHLQEMSRSTIVDTPSVSYPGRANEIT